MILLDAVSQLGFLGFQLCHLVRVGLDGGIVGIDLCLQLGLLGLVGALLQLTEQGAVGLAQLVAGSLQALNFLQAVSYTHLDVYKRQTLHRPAGGERAALGFLGANGLSTLALFVLAVRQTRDVPDWNPAVFAQIQVSFLARFAARWLLSLIHI